MKITIIIEKKSGDNIHVGKFQKDTETTTFKINDAELEKLVKWKLLIKKENTNSKDYYVREFEIKDIEADDSSLKE